MYDQVFSNKLFRPIYIYIYTYINSRSSKFFLTLFFCFFLQVTGYSSAVEFGTPTTISTDNYSGLSFCKEFSKTLRFSFLEVANFKEPYISNSEANTPIISFGGEHISPNSLRLINNFTPPQYWKHYSSTSFSNQKHYETSWL